MLPIENNPEVAGEMAQHVRTQAMCRQKRSNTHETKISLKKYPETQGKHGLLLRRNFVRTENKKN